MATLRDDAQLTVKLDAVLAAQSHTESMLGELLRNIASLPDAIRDRILDSGTQEAIHRIPSETSGTVSVQSVSEDQGQDPSGRTGSSLKVESSQK